MNERELTLHYWLQSFGQADIRQCREWARLAILMLEAGL